jgi:hypothetical protein
MPWNDWQFWVVTLAALVAIAMVLKPLLPWGGSRGRTAKPCSTCPSAEPAAAKRTTLTLGGKRVG